MTERPDRGAYVREVADNARECLRELREQNEALRELVTALEQERQEPEGRLAEQQQVLEGLLRGAGTRLEALVARAGPEFGEERATELERQIGALTALHVTSRRLAEPVDRPELMRAMEEIVANLVGSEELLVFELEEGELRLLHACGLQSGPWARVALGEGPIGAAAAGGEIWLAPGGAGSGADGLSACVPLRLGESVRGLVAIFRLLPHKPALEPLDRELLELLATQGAMALECTRGRPGRREVRA